MERIRIKEAAMEPLQKSIKIANMPFRFHVFTLTSLLACLLSRLLAFSLASLLAFSLIASGCGGGGGGGSSDSGSGSVGSATLTWDAPTTTLYGSELTGTNSISGYRVYYGTSSGNYTSSAEAGNVTSYTVTGLSGGTTYYFAITASNSSGESGYSNEDSKQIN